MLVRDRRASQRASFLAILAFVMVAPTMVLAAGPQQAAPREIPEPRIMEPGDVSGYRLPFEAGLDVRIDQGWNSFYSHNGKAAYAYDFGLHLGTPVLAAAAGAVTFVHDGETGCGGPALRNHANLVVIDHPDGSSTQYGHLADATVEVGEIVTAGQEIGLSGNTGYSGCMPHLHFARQSQGGAVTQSVPIYFQGYPRELLNGDMIRATEPTACAPIANARLNVFCGTYHGGGFDLPALFSRVEPVVNFDLTIDGPGGYWLDAPGSTYAARWTGRFSFASAGRYAIGVVASGGVRVSIDGKPVVDQWSNEGRTINIVVSRTLGAGIREIEVEHLSTGGRDVLKVGWGRLLRDE